MKTWQHKFNFSNIGKITLILVILMNAITISSCSSGRAMTQEEKSRKVKEKISKKEKRKYERAKKKFVRKNYNRQPEKTKKQIDHLAKGAEKWNKNHFNSRKPPFFTRVKIWFKKFIGLFKKREKGLFEEDIH
jgi:hypothetical protein